MCVSVSVRARDRMGVLTFNLLLRDGEYLIFTLNQELKIFYRQLF